ncbi:uncharacterized protein ATNIH1004_003588 [Aspergillus tanneri]|uniref:Uncharacterized protein n=1 Tax=Aspergillus tanneri TaxID=1220188 RepID=A0A5M9N1Q9_9EURO|nr:uncharacterized protein ATNIH1004_003588 [Aspergillus tanneri]KAA8650899.1 hypothetical protein ATNIH1004_003588 [Aspergillus tanneri]
MPSKTKTPEPLFIPQNPHSPNSTLLVLIYRNVLEDSHRTPSGVLSAIDTTAWIKDGQWKIDSEADAATPHYHSMTHETYAVLRRRGKSALDGEPVGNEFNSPD